MAEDFVKKILSLSGISELNTVQKLALEKGLLEEKNMVIATPTASGKTLMAELAMMNIVMKKKKKAVYLAPLIALASEKYESFRKKYEPLGYKIALSVGDFDSSDPWLKEYDIIVCSNEKMDSLLRHGVDWAKDIGIVISDEVHLINDQSRGPTLEIVLTKLHEISNARFLALSATIKNAKDIAKWLGANYVYSEWRPVKLCEGICHENEIIFEGRKESIEFGQPEIEIAKSTLKLEKQALFFVASRRFTESLASQISQAVEKKHIDYESSSKELEKISNDILNVLERPTEQCTKLANCIRNGIAFHHAGLLGKQKNLIEDNFKKGLIKFIVATPTLAMGVSLPAFRVIIRDTKRYYPRLGSVYIPVMEYKQMAGRAGRPEWDAHGEAIIIAKNPREAKEFWSHYINGEPEEIYSKLAVEPVLRTHILALISSGMCSSQNSLNEFFGKTFYSFQYGDQKAMAAKISSLLKKLSDWKMISGFDSQTAIDSFKSADQLDSDNELEPTKIGKRVSELYLDPKTAWKILENLGSESEMNIITFLNMITQTLEMAPGMRIKSGEYEQIAEELEKSREALLGKIPSEWDDEFESFLCSFKTALMLRAWADEKSEEDLLEEFGIAPGELRARLELADWILYAAQELAALSSPRNREKLIELRKARTRLKYGVKEDLLQLVKLKNIGRARARKLHAAGIRNSTQINSAPLDKLKSLLGEKIADKIKKDAERES